MAAYALLRDMADLVDGRSEPGPRTTVSMARREPDRAMTRAWPVPRVLWWWTVAIVVLGLAMMVG